MYVSSRRRSGLSEFSNRSLWSVVVDLKNIASGFISPFNSTHTKRDRFPVRTGRELRE